MEKWVVVNKKGEIAKLSQTLGLSNIVVKLICNRGLCEEEEIKEYLHPGYEAIHSPFAMKGMDKACATIRDTINSGAKIRIIGDYDADGVTATYVLLSGLKKLNANVDYRIPDRVRDGYGINENLVREAAADGVSLIVTCDNGIRAVAQIALAYELGMKVVLTDHHDIPAEVPKAEVILNPKYEPCEYPFSEICGALVALKLIEALNCHEGERHNFDVFRQYCEIVTISTICDVVTLQGENRAVVKYGFQKFRGQMKDAPAINTGIRALMQASNINPEDITTTKIGYTIGPCINANGRIETAVTGVELLLAEEFEQALEIAQKTIDTNAERKILTSEALEEALDAAEAENSSGNDVLVLLLEKCHESIAGIVAGKIKEKYEKPTIVLTNGKDCIKGSARSIEAVNITEELDKCSDLLLKHGGHAMAAGLSLNRENYEALKKKLNDNCKLRPEDMEKKVYIDIAVPANYINLDVCEQIHLLEPFGNGNAPVAFAEKNAEITALIPFGKEAQYLRIRCLNESGAYVEITSFRNREDFENDLKSKYGETALENLYRRKACGVRFSFIYSAEINEFRGDRNVQYRLENYRF